MSVIPATWKAEVGGQLGQKHETSSEKQTKKKKAKRTGA
jgi:hypothetical protein